MNRFFFLTFLISLAACSLNAQNYEEVVYLKNGSIIHGLIIEQIPNKSIKIQTKDGNLFVFDIEEVEKITKEPVKEENLSSNNSYSQPKGEKSNVNALNPGMSFLCSFLLPGAGQFYNGQKGRGALMLGVDVTALGLGVFAYNWRGPNWWHGETLFYICIVSYMANSLWSMIDAPLSAQKINLKNGLSLNYKLNKHADLALRPDFKLETLGGSLNPVYGAKLSLNLH
jgi:TM2 domain-containing membrane protein YozV